MYYEHEFLEKKTNDKIENPIYVNDFESDTFIKIICIDSLNNKKINFLTDIDGGFYLREAD